MAVTLPEGDLKTRLSRYLDGFNTSHGLEDSLIEGNLVQVVVKPEDVPAVLTTARAALGGLPLSLIPVGVRTAARAARGGCGRGWSAGSGCARPAGGSATRGSWGR